MPFCHLSSQYWFKELIHSPWFHPLLLLVWLAMGTALRLSHLGALPPWTDECATMVFSLGNTFQTVPLNELIGSEVLLQPLQPTPDAGINTVFDRLMQESTHPPVYFILTHLWMKLFPTTDGLVSLWGARSLSTVLGVASIPALFGLGYLGFRSPLVGQIAAAIMAVSPYGIFLAQDARHYTLAILLVIASLCCLLRAVQAIQGFKPLPHWVGLLWVGVNSLGVATHYFFTLTLSAEALVLLGQAWQQGRQNYSVLVRSHWRRIYGVAAGTLIGGLVWLPALQTIYGSEPTNWIYDGNPTAEWLAPMGRVLIWVLSMVVLLPSAVTILPIGIVVISGIVTLLFLGWIVPSVNKGIQLQQQRPDTRLAIQVLGGYLVSAIALVFGFTYALGMDLTLGARFQFVYFPVVIVLLGSSLAEVWQQRHQNWKDREAKGISSPLYELYGTKNNTIATPFFSLRFRLSLLKKGKAVVTLIWLMGLLGGLTVIWNLGYLQNHRPDLLVPIIREASQVPVLIATTHKHHGQTGRTMGLAWEFKRLSVAHSAGNTRTDSIQFFLAHRDPKTRSYQTAVEVLQANLAKLPRPLDLWLVDFRSPVNLESQNCFRDSDYGSSAGEYNYKLYRCR